MKIDSKISKAKAKLLVEYPLFGTIASKLELVLNDDIQTFKSDGIKLQYNSDFFSNLSLSEMEFVFANGAMHASLAHESRKNNRSGWLWQMATDFAINDMLVENGMNRPELAQYRKRFKGMYAEEIYAQLQDDLLKNDGELEYNPNDLSDVESEVNLESSSKSNQSKKVNRREASMLSSSTKQAQLQDITQSEQLFEEFAKATLDAEQKKDELPKNIERFFELNTNGVINWRDELRAAIDKYNKDDFALIPPNKKFLHLGIYLPSNISQKFKLVVAIDSSGSIDEELLGLFISELNFLMSTITNYEIDLLVCDDIIKSHNKYFSGDILDVDVIGGGGTDFRPVFNFIENELTDTNLLLYFSDLDGIFPENEPNYEVKWISSNECTYPFGELISLKNHSTIT